MTSLTPRQQELLQFIEQFISANRYPPSHRQMAARMGSTAVRGVQQLLDQLQKKGYVVRTPGVSRGLRLLQGATRSQYKAA